MKPFVKWAGGKRQILSEIKNFIIDSIQDGEEFTYIEPFLGGGAVFFDLKPKKAIINDLNEDLINAYKVIQSDDYLKLINKLKEHNEEYHKDKVNYYYEVREKDRNENWPLNNSNVDRAARMIFLNKTCYNGLYRVNSKGEFNTPIGRYSNPLICDESNINEVHEFLSSKINKIEIMNKSYEKAIEKANDGDIIYIDPPYDYEDDDGFTKYQMAGFTFEDFKELKDTCDKAINKGAFVIISNNATKKVLELFDEDPKYKIYYDVSEFNTLRYINCKGAERRTGREVIIWGMSNNVLFPQANDMEKIVRLLLAGEEVISNKQKAMEVLQVSSERQVAYYLSALVYLNYLKQNKDLTDRFYRLNGDEKNIKKDIFEQLMQNDIINEAYNRYKREKRIENEFLISNFKSRNKNISNSTLKRRVSTIKSWIEWMYKFNE